MFAALTSLSRLVIVLVLPLFGTKRTSGLAKGLGTGFKELHQEILTGDVAEAEASESEKEHGEARSGSEEETVGARTGQESL